MVDRVKRYEKILSTQHDEPANQTRKLGMDFDATVSDESYMRICTRAAILEMGRMDWSLYEDWQDEGQK